MSDAVLFWVLGIGAAVYVAVVLIEIAFKIWMWRNGK